VSDCVGAGDTYVYRYDVNNFFCRWSIKIAFFHILKYVSAKLWMLSSIIYVIYEKDIGAIEYFVGGFENIFGHCSSC
jgi:hypothetical protein